MNVIISDRSILTDVPPEAVFALLKRIGGRKSGEREGLSFWSIPDYGQLAFPMDTHLADYANHVAKVLSIAERATKESQFEVLRSMQSIGYDVVRLPRMTGADNHYNVPIQIGLKALSSLHDILLASAFAAVDKRAALPSNRPRFVNDYMQSLKLGQYLNGKLSFAILSPVAQDASLLQTSFLEPEKTGAKTSFERTVVVTMLNAFEAAQDAANRAAISGQYGYFEETVQEGVNATLCDAIADLIDTDPEQKPYLSIDWSPRLESRAPYHLEMRSPQEPKVYRTAARRLREISELEYELFGQVVGVRREIAASLGKVTLATLIEGRPGHVTFSLGEPEYHAALFAHKTRSTVFVSGTLKREGNVYSLRDPKDFRVLEPPPV